MTPARQLYELWSRDSEIEERAGESLSPRGKDWLFELFASLDPQPGELVVDVGARDGRHMRRLVEAHDLRGVGLDPVPRDPDVIEGSIEALPLDDGAADWIWCRDVLPHVDVERGLAECARVLRPGGRIVTYVTVATDLLEPLEAAWLADACALATLDGRRIEVAAAAAGFADVEKIVIGSEWRERMIEDGEWDANEALLRIARLRRLGETGEEAQSIAADKAWGIYQLLGKLCPTVYVWERRV